MSEIDSIHQRLEHLQTADLGWEGNELRTRSVKALIAHAGDAVFEIMAELGMV